MKKIVFPVLCSALLLLFTGCPPDAPGPEYKLTMYISLGLSSAYTAAHPVADINDLAEFGGKQVVFSVAGLDEGVNNTINIQTTDQFGWTGGDVSTSTQYASAVIDLGEDGAYPGGRYRFRMYIDWDGSSTLNSGDLVFASYSLLADKDGNADTASLPVTADEYGTAVEYSSSDYSVIINDPLGTDAGLAWIITEVHEGTLADYP